MGLPGSYADCSGSTVPYAGHRRPLRPRFRRWIGELFPSSIGILFGAEIAEPHDFQRSSKIKRKLPMVSDR